MNTARRFGWLALGLALSSAAGAMALPPDDPPEWTEEPPRLSRWIEEGFDAQKNKQPLLAAERYCAAARFGSAEAQYRLGRLYLVERTDAAAKDEALTLLSIAAQRGHEKAAQALQGQRAGEAIPDCLLSGRAPVFALPPPPEPAVEPVVPLEVVERYMLALPSDKRRHAQLIRHLAPRFEVDFRFALAIARAESNFDPMALSPKNAMGLMQLIPDTAARFGVKNAFDPEQNVRGGLAYLRWLLDRFGGDVALASAAYNAGEGAVDRHGGVPPFRETQQYVQRILHFYRSPVHTKPGPM
jgi:soluble lytic murein transglycosylase-like protein